MKNKKSISTVILSLFLLFSSAVVSAQTNEFTYQGRLNDGSIPANANYDFIFTLCATASDCFNSNRLDVRTRLGVSVNNGAFTVMLDFPATDFNGADRWLEIRVSPAGSGTYTELTPRQRITSSPYAIRSLNAANANTATSAATATNSTQLGGVAANLFVQTNDLRLSNSRNPLPGSTEYIQNNSGPPQPGNFAISGNGLIGGNALVSGNLTVNGNATASFYNAALNYRIGGQRVVGAVAPNNTYVGIGTGLSSAGADNSFFGFNAGGANGLGNDNSFFGSDAGGVNNDGNNNSFFGSDTGDSNTSGSDNSFFGRSAGSANTTGNNNAFFGKNVGLSNVNGHSNSFFGTDAGDSNTSGSNNSFFGRNAGSANNGSINSFFGVNAGLANTSGGSNSFFGYAAGDSNTNGSGNAFFGDTAGGGNTGGANNTFIGRRAGLSNTTGSSNTYIGVDSNGSADITNATAIGAGAFVSESNTTVIGGSTVRMADLFASTISIINFASGANSSPLCTASVSGGFGRIGFCSSSLRYKTNIASFNPGLNLVKRLRPITFNWKDGGTRDMGLVAEEVAAVEPLLAVYDKDGKVEGVKYDRIGVILLNAVKEQQIQIESQKNKIEVQQKQLKQQQQQFDALKKLVCQSNAQSEVCQQ